MKMTGLKIFLTLVVPLLCISGMSWGDAQAQDISGLSLKLYGSDPDNTENVYALESDPKDPDKNYVIPLMLVLKNISGQPINVERGFSQVELHRALKVVDPCGTPLELPPDVEFVYDAGKPRFVGDRALIPAEVLDTNFARTLRIDDLRELFPVMYVLPGVYTISAQLKGARFFVTEFDDEHGLQGVSLHRSNWFGIIDAHVGSNDPPDTQLKVVILPARGARVKLKLEQQILETIQPLFGIPIKVFAGDITGDLADVWTEADLEAVLSGTTKTNGEVAWECNLCIPQSTYTILLKIADQFQQIEIPAADIRWGEGCSGLIEEGFLYEEPVVITAKFSVFALNSIWLRPRSIIHSGDVGVMGASDGPHLKKGFEIYVDRRAQTKEGVKLIGDSIYIAKEAKVFDVHYNELDNQGVIQGEQITPLELPVWEGPEFSAGDHGSEDVRVGYRKTRTLEPGDYEDVKVKPKGGLILTGGTYQFRSLSLNYLASVKCLAPTIILVKRRFYAGLKSYVGPDPNSAFGAKDVIIYIDGQNGGSGKPVSLPMASTIGLSARVRANMFTPNGTLWIGAESTVEGAFVANDVVVGMGADVKLESAFQ